MKICCFHVQTDPCFRVGDTEVQVNIKLDSWDRNAKRVFCHIEIIFRCSVVNIQVFNVENHTHCSCACFDSLSPFLPFYLSFSLSTLSPLISRSLSLLLAYALLLSVPSLSRSLSLALSLSIQFISKKLYWHELYTFALPKQVNNKINSVMK